MDGAASGSSGAGLAADSINSPLGLFQLAQSISSIASGLQKIVATAHAAERSVDAERRLQSSRPEKQTDSDELQAALRRLEEVKAAAQSINADLTTVVQLQGVSSILTYLEPISVPWILEKAADTVDTHLEGRGVEVAPLVRLPGLHHSINTVRFVFQQAVFAVANEAASCLRNANGKCKYILVAELATRIESPEDNPNNDGAATGTTSTATATPASSLSSTPSSSSFAASTSGRYVLIRALTSGCKVSPDMLEELFDRSDGDGGSLGLADVARSVRSIGGDVGASTDGLRAEFWIAVPENAAAGQNRPKTEREASSIGKAPCADVNTDTARPKQPPAVGTASTLSSVQPDTTAALGGDPPAIALPATPVATKGSAFPTRPPTNGTTDAEAARPKTGFVPSSSAPRPISFKLKAQKKTPGPAKENGVHLQDNAPPLAGLPPTTPPPWKNKTMSPSPKNGSKGLDRPISAAATMRRAPDASAGAAAGPAAAATPSKSTVMPSYVRPQSWPNAVGSAQPEHQLHHARTSDPSANRRRAAIACAAGSPSLTRAAANLDSSGSGSPGSASRHGRANADHAKRAAKELGLDPVVWGDMKVSLSVVECRPYSADFRRCLNFAPSSAHQKDIRKYRLGRARAVLVLPTPGTVATVSEYLHQWGIMQDAGQDFREAMAKVKQRNESLKERGKPLSAVSLIIADIDGSIENPRRRVPENMLLRKNLRFILLCSRGQLKLFQSQENRWFNQALDYVVVTKPIHRQALWKAVTNPKQQKPAQPRTSADSPGPQLPRSPTYSPKVRRSLSPLQWISEGEDCNILIAEDNETNILVVRSFLAALGHTAKIVRDGAACVAEFAENRRNATSSNRYRLIFMDCIMPKMDGFEAATQIRAIEQSDGGETTNPIPIVAMTGFTAPEEHDRCIASGMTDHLPKPFSKDQLNGKLTKYVKHGSPSPGSPSRPDDDDDDHTPTPFENSESFV